MSTIIDLNSDLGEPSPGADVQIMPFISSCNIACGGHAGDAETLRNTVDLAIENNVTIGAHPGFPDRGNFGRVVMEISNENLYDSLTEQILMTKRTAEEAGQRLHHVKPHGALFNLAGTDRIIAELIGDCLAAIDPTIKWYGLAHSVTEEVAGEKDIPFVREAFADRRYQQNRTLMSRTREDAVIHDNETVLRQAEELTFRHRALSGDEWLDIQAQTICLHSDTKGAVNLAKAIHNHLVEKGATITSV